MIDGGARLRGPYCAKIERFTTFAASTLIPETMNADNLIFREATEADLAFLSEILVEAAAASGVCVPLDDLSSYPETYQYVDQFPTGTDIGVVAQSVEGQLVGAAWVRMLPTDAHAVNDPLPELTMGVIAPFRRMGVGERLLTALCKAAADKQIPEISLGVHQKNLPAVELYRKQGWREDGMFGDYIMMSCKTDFI